MTSTKERLATLKARSKPAEAAYVEGGKAKAEVKVDKPKRVKTGGRKKATEINLKQREFVDLYMGGPDELRGNATACYRHLHPRASLSTCKTEGSKCLTNPHVKQYLAAKAQLVTEKTYRELRLQKLALKQ